MKLVLSKPSLKIKIGPFIEHPGPLKDKAQKTLNRNCKKTNNPTASGLGTHKVHINNYYFPKGLRYKLKNAGDMNFRENLEFVRFSGFSPLLTTRSGRPASYFVRIFIL